MNAGLRVLGMDCLHLHESVPRLFQSASHVKFLKVAELL